MLILVHFLFLLIFQYILSSWFVTNKRILDFATTPYVRDDTMFINIGEIHQIEKHKHGLMQNIFNYGDIIINLLAIRESIVLHYVPDPSLFVSIVELIQAGRIEQAKHHHYKQRKRFLP